ncbi:MULTISPECIES: lysophospholipid acyltransferase [unclassified Mycobacterium]|uniref:lysophospholipid acyltransferase n=1 Tax=unclassified Mycobacterium TaxID=2642494 RepID=UPI0009E8C112|nr:MULTISPECIES: lysophospholipid acyltransferase [unclassified Mycobacterium]
MDRSRTRSPEVAALLADARFDAALQLLAEELDRDPHEVRREAAGYLQELSSRHDPAVGAAWNRFGRWLLRAYDLMVDEAELAGLRALDAHHSLIFLPSHRSYLDAWILPRALSTCGLSPAFGFIGANLNFFPFGTLARRAGHIMVRRNTKDSPLYRLALRSYIGQLVHHHQNLAWAIEGGRTRTGKLRPPMFGILRYVLDAVHAVDGPEVFVIPVSLDYDQLHEVPMMTAELGGGAKSPENARWLIGFARQQGRHLGNAYVNFGEPIPVRKQTAALRVQGADRIIERVAVQVCHHINRATPVTATALVCLALLPADRAMTLPEIQQGVRPLVTYITRRGWHMAGRTDLSDPRALTRTLGELEDSGVVEAYDGGTDTVWRIRPAQHLVAAFYRNTAIHILVDRAIGEVALVAAAESDAPPRRTARNEALRLRDLLKFDFFFSPRETFDAEMRTELALLENAEGGLAEPADALRLLRHADLHLAPLVLRPILDAYHVVAIRLTQWSGPEFDEKAFLRGCLGVGRQWELQGRLGNAESVSLELFKTALQLARHRGLLNPSTPDGADRRQEFAEEVADALRRIEVIRDLARRIEAPQ